MAGKFLIIDDSALMRRVISDIIKHNSEYEVLDLAENGLQGLDLIIAHPGYYDLIILDINMPKMNGLEMLENLQKNHLHETVVVVSTLTKEGAKETLFALEHGALDFVTKPENFYEVKGEGFRTKILKFVNMVSDKNVDNKLCTFEDKIVKSVIPVKTPKKSNAMRGNKKIVAIACSTGGPKSLQDVIPYLPANLDAGVVLVQHMPKGFTASLAARLNSLSEIDVSEAVDGEPILKGHVYIAPGGRHMKVVTDSNRSIIRISDEKPVEGLRPCANIMYESLKTTNYNDVTCVVLTGMGADGTQGIKSLSESDKHIHVISQDADSCIVYGMPRTIAESGLSDEVVSLNKIAERIIKNVGVS